VGNLQDLLQVVAVVVAAAGKSLSLVVVLQASSVSTV